MINTFVKPIEVKNRWQQSADNSTFNSVKAEKIYRLRINVQWNH
jgi:hypothetical protein